MHKSLDKYAFCRAKTNIYYALMCARLYTVRTLWYQERNVKPEKAAFSRQNRPNETFDVARKTHQKFIWHNKKENDNEAKQSIVCNCNRCNACGSFRRLR